MGIPTTLAAGVNWEWSASFADYPASEYALTYVLINSTNKITISAAADGDDFAVSVAAATTAGYAAGDYGWQAIAVSGSDKYLAASGEVTVTADLAAAATYDVRSHAEKVLEAIEAVLEDKASRDQQMVMIGGRQVISFTPMRLLELRDYYRAEAARERARKRLLRGESPGRTVKVRFV
jgi:hypothetical protein